MTEYAVLGNDGGDQWSVIYRGSARSAQAAIREALESPEALTTEGDRYVAVPARSWRPVTVKVETKTALRFS